MVLAEYYTNQAPGEPKFVLQPGNGFGYDVFVNEAEALWENGSDYDLDSERTTVTT